MALYGVQSGKGFVVERAIYRTLLNTGGRVNHSVKLFTVPPCQAILPTAKLGQPEWTTLDHSGGTTSRKSRRLSRSWVPAGAIRVRR